MIRPESFRNSENFTLPESNYVGWHMHQSEGQLSATGRPKFSLQKPQEKDRLSNTFGISALGRQRQVKSETCWPARGVYSQTNYRPCFKNIMVCSTVEWYLRRSLSLYMNTHTHVPAHIHIKEITCYVHFYVLSTMGAWITPHVKYINICTTKSKKQDW